VLAVRGVRALGGASSLRAVRDSPHAQARLMAEHGGDRDKRIEPPVPRPTHPVDGGDGRGGTVMGGAAERRESHGAMAVHHGGRKDQAAAFVSTDLVFVVH